LLPPPEFAKEMEKIWGLWCMCSVMDELKQINRISSFKFLIVESLPLEYKEFFVKT
jgi:hypothetical protein